MMKVNMNETRKAVLGVLKEAKEPMTLAEISAVLGADVRQVLQMQW